MLCLYEQTKRDKKPAATAKKPAEKKTKTAKPSQKVALKKAGARSTPVVKKNLHKKALSVKKKKKIMLANRQTEQTRRRVMDMRKMDTLNAKKNPSYNITIL
uniref:Uncharacterized protein n=1 Tax=Cacopsylla melanoneura TaxID=428564 RepID=A0A8D9E4X8_9HEMI